MATTLKPLDKILSNVIDFNYKDYIGTVPFVRIYTYHKNGYELPFILIKTMFLLVKRQ